MPSAAHKDQRYYIPQHHVHLITSFKNLIVSKPLLTNINNKVC